MQQGKTYPGKPDSEEPTGCFMPPKPVKEVFKVPEGYFDSLSGRIRDRMSEKDSTRLPVLKAMHRIQRWAWISVCGIVVVCLFFFLFNPFSTKVTTPVADNSDTMNLISGYDASYAAEALTDEYIEVNDMIDKCITGDQNELSFVTSTDDGISSEDICDYLQEQELDTDVLAEMQTDLSTDL